jgi:indole-3-glycerol phosphate synthase
VGVRRLSQAIAEGDGISLLVEVADLSEASAVGARGAEGLVLRGGSAASVEASRLPVLAFGLSPDAAAAARADAVVLAAATDTEELELLAQRAEELGLEVVVHVSDEDDFERVLEEVDPEILLLSADAAEDDQHPLDRLLELLPDVPAGKLAIADLGSATREEIEELERAGVDAVVVTGELDGLAGDVLPEV